MTYKTKITTSAQVVQVSEEGVETVLYGQNKFIPVRIAEMVCSDLNKGFTNAKPEDYE